MGERGSGAGDFEEHRGDWRRQNPQVRRWTSVTGTMSNVRGDIAAAANRMRVVFGTRSAMKHLVHSLEAGENVREMVACLFAGANGLLVLTDRRVLALRDDYSRYSMKAAVLSEITLIDYGPRVHDGLAVFTDSGRVAVRKMNREDSDRFVEVLTGSLPAVPVVTSQPSARATNAPGARAAAAAKGARLAARAATTRATGQAAAVEGAARTTTVAGPDGSSTQFFDASDATVLASTGALPVTAPVLEPIAAPTLPDPARPAVATDKEVLYGVLADLHAKGLLTAEELAVKVAAVAATS